MNSQTEKTAKRVVIISLLVLVLLILAVIKVSYGKSKVIGTGYLIYNRSGNTESGSSFQDLTMANQLVDFYFDGINIDFEKELKYSNFINIRKDSKEIYIEKKIILQKKNGKLIYRKLTNKRKRQLEKFNSTHGRTA